MGANERVDDGVVQYDDIEILWTHDPQPYVVCAQRLWACTLCEYGPFLELSWHTAVDVLKGLQYLCHLQVIVSRDRSVDICAFLLFSFAN